MTFTSSKIDSITFWEQRLFIMLMGLPFLATLPAALMLTIIMTPLLQPNCTQLIGIFRKLFQTSQAELSDGLATYMSGDLAILVNLLE